MMRRWVVCGLFILGWGWGAFAEEEPLLTPTKAETVSPQDMEVVRMMEVLELMDIAENMDLLEDMDIIAEEENDEQTDS